MNQQEAVLEVIRKLRTSGHQAFLVGGCVRDRLLGFPVKDMDVATSARPEQVSALFGDTKFVGSSFGVCLVDFGDHRFEVATFRKDGAYIDHRRPESVEFGTMLEDVNRRDFTINALFMDPEDDSVIDLVAGGDDIYNRILRAVGDPRSRFNEDPLRLLRAVRFAAGLNLRISDDTFDAMRELAPTIVSVSGERLRDELTRMLMGPRPSRAFHIMDETGMLAHILPEVSAMKGVEQEKKHHPEGDVFVHTMLCIDNLDLRTPVACWAMLLHDVGKPATFSRGDDGVIHFYEHDDVGAAMVPSIAQRFKFSNDDAARIQQVVSRHMRPHFSALKWGKGAIRRYLGADTIVEDLAVHRSDCLSSSKTLDTHAFLVQALAEFQARNENPIPPPLITGDDLIKMGFKPGPLFKEILGYVQEAQLEGLVSNREVAILAVTERYDVRFRNVKKSAFPFKYVEFPISERTYDTYNEGPSSSLNLNRGEKLPRNLVDFKTEKEAQDFVQASWELDGNPVGTLGYKKNGPSTFTIIVFRAFSDLSKTWAMMKQKYPEVTRGIFP